MKINCKYTQTQKADLEKLNKPFYKTINSALLREAIYSKFEFYCDLTELFDYDDKPLKIKNKYKFLIGKEYCSVIINNLKQNFGYIEIDYELI